MTICKKILSNFSTAITLGANPFYKIKFFFVSFVLPLKRILRIPYEVCFSIKLKNSEGIFWVHLTDGSDVGVLKEMFIEEQYKWDLEYRPKVILDIGSNVGFSVIYFKLKYPEAVIYAFEPDPATYKKLQRNTKKLNNVHIFNMALSDKDGEELFFVYPGSSMSSSLFPRVDNQKSIKVPSRKLDTFIAEQEIKKIDLIKFDVEGGEFQIFSSFKKLDNIPMLIGELHLDLIPVKEDVFMEIFKSFVVQKVKISSQRFLLKMYKISNGSLTG